MESKNEVQTMWSQVEELGCPTCSTQYSTKHFLINEVCGHGACRACLTAHVEGSLLQCDWERTIRVPCPAPSCCKAVAQATVMEVSSKACELAEHIEANDDPHVPYPLFFPHKCLACSRDGKQLMENVECNHFICVECWTKHADESVDAMQTESVVSVACPYPGCNGPVAMTAIEKCDAADSSVSPSFAKCCAAQREALATMSEYEFEGLKIQRGPHTSKGPICPICAEHSLVLINLGDCADGHSACLNCWVRWMEVLVDESRMEKRRVCRCMHPGCTAVDSPTVPSIWKRVCKSSQAVRDVDAQILRRETLQDNKLFPREVQVNCPLVGCVGLGYLGYDTVMCFLCEHQWLPESDDQCKSAETSEENIMGLGLKRCPKCQEYIEKNGGCDHMICRCRHSFAWTTLKPWS